MDIDFDKLMIKYFETDDIKSIYDVNDPEYNIDDCDKKEFTSKLQLQKFYDLILIKNFCRFVENEMRKEEQ